MRPSRGVVELAVVVGIVAVSVWWLQPPPSAPFAPEPDPATVASCGYGSPDFPRPAWWDAAIKDLDDHAQEMPGYTDVRNIDPVTLPRVQAGEGARLYYMYCASCHGDSGFGNGPVAAAITTGPPTNLHRPDNYKRGTLELAIFRTSKYGIPGTGMAPVAANDQELWAITGYVRTLEDAKAAPSPRT